MSNLKKLIHERMAKTGESYQAAHRHVTRERADTAHSQPTPPLSGDTPFLVSAPPPRRGAYVVDSPMYSSGAEVLSALVPEPLKTEPSTTGPTLPEHFEKLGQLRADGDMLEQQVLVGPWRISYSLGAAPDDVGITVGGVGDAPLPEWVFPTARRYLAANKVRILELLHAARYEEFRAEHDGVSATLQTELGEIDAWYTRWDEDHPVIQRARGIEYSVAQSLALAKFRAVPEEVRKRLFRVARPWESDADADVA